MEQFDRAASALEKALQLGYAISTGWPGTPTSTSSASNPFTGDLEAKIRRMKVKVG